MTIKELKNLIYERDKYKKLVAQQKSEIERLKNLNKNQSYILRTLYKKHYSINYNENYCVANRCYINK